MKKIIPPLNTAIHIRNLVITCVLGMFVGVGLVKATCDGTGFDGCSSGYSCSGSPTIQTYTCGPMNSANPPYCPDVRGSDQFLSCNGSCQWSSENSPHGCLNRYTPGCSNDTSNRTGNCCSACTSPPTAVPTSPPGCVPGGCDTSNCGSTSCGNACGWNGCGTCSSGTQNCTSDQAAKGANDGLRYADPVACVLAGWVCDPDNYNRSIDYHVYEPDSNGTFRGGGNAAAYRADVAAAGWACGGTGNHGVEFSVPSSLRDGSSHTLTIYALGINSGGGYTGSNPAVGTASLTCNPVAPTCGAVSLGISNPYCLTSGTYNMSVSGVSNATAVRFVTWTSANGAGDAVWQNASGGGANWSATINAGAYGPEDGNVWHEVYARNGSGPEVWCAGAGYTRNCLVPTAPPPTIPPPTVPPTPIPPTPIPACPPSFNPSPVSVSPGGSTTLTVTPDAACGAVSSISFSSANPAVVTASGSDSSSPYQTTVNGIATGSTTITATVNYSAGFSRSGSVTANCNPGPTTPPTPSCTVSTNTISSLLVNGTSNITASISLNGGAVIDPTRGVNFGSYNTTIATVSPTTDTSPSTYSTVVTGRAVGNTAVWATVFLNGGNSCTTSGSADTDVTVNPGPTSPPISPTSPPGACTQPPPRDPPTCSALNTVTWQWTAVAGATQYEPDIYNSSGTLVINNGWLTAASLGCGSGGTCTYVTSGMANGTYYNRVRAQGSCGPSNFSQSQNVNVPCPPPTIVPTATPLPTPTPTPTPPPCNTAAPRDPPSIDCETSSITWKWCEVAGANSYEADILTTGDSIDSDADTVAPPYIDNNWWLPSPPNIICDVPDLTCPNGQACTYTTGPNMPDGAYQSATRARNTGNSCTPSNWSTSAVMNLSCTTIHFAGGGGDIIAAGGLLRSLLPPFGPPPYFIDETKANTPGIAIGRGVTINTNQVNSEEWLVDHPFAWTTLSVKPENQYLYLTERIVAQASPVAVTTSSVSSQGGWDSLVNSASAANKLTLPDSAGDVVLLRRTGNLAFDTPVDVGSRKVILMVDGNVTINNTLTFSGGDASTPGSGFFALFASGNITVSGSVGAATSGAGTGPDIRLENYPPHLEGIFYAGGTFDTGGTTNKLRVDGTVIGYTGVTLGRQYKGKDPGTYFLFRPDLTVTLYEVGLRRKVFQELVNP